LGAGLDVGAGLAGEQLAVVPGEGRYLALGLGLGERGLGLDLRRRRLLLLVGVVAVGLLLLLELVGLVLGLDLARLARRRRGARDTHHLVAEAGRGAVVDQHRHAALGDRPAGVDRTDVTVVD